MTRTILLADDSLTIRKVVELTFAGTDVRVEAVESGREALERLDALRPDLILADVVMPGPTGYEICERVKASSRPVPVLLLAGTFEAFDPVRAKQCGADGHLVKPFESRTLVERVESLLARGPLPLPLRQKREEEEELEAVLDDLAGREESASPEPDRGAAEAEPKVPAPPRPGAPEPVPTPSWALEAAATVVPASPPSPGTAEAAEAPAPIGWPQLSAEETDAIARALLEQVGGVDAIARAVVEQIGGIDAIARAALLRLGGIEAIARPIVERLGGEALREVAWEVVPDLAEALIRERLREIEREERGRG